MYHPRDDDDDEHAASTIASTAPLKPKPAPWDLTRDRLDADGALASLAGAINTLGGKLAATSAGPALAAVLPAAHSVTVAALPGSRATAALTVQAWTSGDDLVEAVLAASLPPVLASPLFSGPRLAVGWASGSAPRGGRPAPAQRNHLDVLAHYPSVRFNRDTPSMHLTAVGPVNAARPWLRPPTPDTPAESSDYLMSESDELIALIEGRMTPASANAMDEEPATPPPVSAFSEPPATPAASLVVVSSTPATEEPGNPVAEIPRLLPLTDRDARAVLSALCLLPADVLPATAVPLMIPTDAGGAVGMVRFPPSSTASLAVSPPTILPPRALPWSHPDLADMWVSCRAGAITEAVVEARYDVAPGIEVRVASLLPSPDAVMAFLAANESRWDLLVPPAPNAQTSTTLLVAADPPELAVDEHVRAILFEARKCEAWFRGETGWGIDGDDMGVDRPAKRVRRTPLIERLPEFLAEFRVANTTLDSMAAAPVPAVATVAGDSADFDDGRGRRAWTPRVNLDFSEQLWLFALGAVDEADLLAVLAGVVDEIETGRIQPQVKAENDTDLARACKRAQHLGTLPVDSPDRAAVWHEVNHAFNAFLEEPLAGLVDVGVWKLSRDLVHALAPFGVYGLHHPLHDLYDRVPRVVAWARALAVVTHLDANTKGLSDEMFPVVAEWAINKVDPLRAGLDSDSDSEPAPAPTATAAAAADVGAFVLPRHLSETAWFVAGLLPAAISHWTVHLVAKSDEDHDERVDAVWAVGVRRCGALEIHEAEKDAGAFENHAFRIGAPAASEEENGLIRYEMVVGSAEFFG
ncbi:hypothetical protein H9P43_003313 [Blastocladiella emersonii ATCC 22665]|nr:hypothetical protein H9P43_003313 [Blastocladiella emersonii ATCC 22665]